jgi:hypothetical protein
VFVLSPGWVRRASDELPWSANGRVPALAAGLQEDIASRTSDLEKPVETGVAGPADDRSIGCRAVRDARWLAGQAGQGLARTLFALFQLGSCWLCREGEHDERPHRGVGMLGRQNIETPPRPVGALK